MIKVHTDVVGSLLRPPDLLRARRARTDGDLSQSAFEVIEDRAVARAIRIQETAGLEVVTDGEMRRLSFQSQLTDAVAGFSPCDIDSFLWGQWFGGEGLGSFSLERPQGLGVVGKLHRKRYLSVAEFQYLCTHTNRIPKVSLPSPSLWTHFWSQDLSSAAYPTQDRFLADLVDILRDEVRALVRCGARYLQIDAPHYPLLLDPATRSFYEAQGWSLKDWLDRGIEMDNALMEDFPDVTFGFHL